MLDRSRGGGRHRARERAVRILVGCCFSGLWMAGVGWSADQEAPRWTPAKQPLPPQAASATDSAAARAARERGIARREAGASALALSDLRAAYRVLPQDRPTLLAMAGTLVELGAFAEALHFYDIVRTPGMRPVNEARAFAALGDAATARRLLEELAYAEAATPEARNAAQLELGRLLLRTGDAQQGRQLLNGVVARDSTQLEGALELGLEALRSGAPERALAILEPALGRAPTERGLLYATMRAHAVAGNSRRAAALASAFRKYLPWWRQVATAHRALRADPNLIDPYLHVAAAFRALGHSERGAAIEAVARELQSEAPRAP